MLKGQLWATSDINEVMLAIQNGFKAIYLGDPVSANPVIKENFVFGTSLTPDNEAMAMKIDGNDYAFLQMYFSSLHSAPATELISVILACLFKGTNIMLFLPPEAKDLNFIEYLLQFIQINYGVMTRTKSTQFGFDMKFKDKVLELLYLNSLINAQEFLVKSDNVNDNILKKLVVELRPMVENPRDLDQILQWFSNYKDQLISANKPLINGVQYAGETGDYVCY